MSSQSLRIGGSTFSFMWKEPARASMERMRQLGLNDFDVLLVPGHLWMDDLTPGDVAELRGQLKSGDIRIESLNLPALDLNPCSCVPEFRAYSVTMYQKALRLSADLGGRAVVVVPGRVSALLPPGRNDTLNWLTESIASLLETAEQLDQKLFLELHPQTPVPTASQIGDFVDRFDSPRVQIAYDVASAEFIGEDYVAAIGRLGKRIGQFHLSDSTRTAWRHDALGRGTVDIPSALAAIEQNGCEGATILEIISSQPIEEMKASLERIATIADGVSSSQN
jgi:L-ribulose-5-phosphate 3-epimerase